MSDETRINCPWCGTQVDVIDDHDQWAGEWTCDIVVEPGGKQWGCEREFLVERDGGRWKITKQESDQ